MSSGFYLYSGMAGFLYGTLALLRYYTLSGSQLLDSKEANRMIRKGEIKTVVDVRTKTEWDLGHYPKAVHIPITNITKDKVKGLKEGILVYCNTGQRARSGAEMIMGFGKKKVYYISGTYKSLNY